MRVLITGGAGFIGSHIADQLAAGGHTVAALDDLSSGRRENLPAGVKLFEADIRDKEALQSAFDDFRPQAVLHQAAQMSVSRSVREPTFDAQVNLIGLLNVLENCVRVKAHKVVFASSGGVLYGDVTEPAEETAPANPLSPYGISKWAGEQYLRFFSREHGLKTVALRYSNVYGPRQNPHGEAGVVAIFATKMLAGEAAVINGDGRFIRDYVFVGDVARANLLALERDLPEAFVPMNVGTGVPTDVTQLAEKMRPLCVEFARAKNRAIVVPAPVHGPARAGDLRSNLVSFRRAQELLGWKPIVALDAGLRETVDSFGK